VRHLAVLLALALLAGCVTTESGGLPKAKPVDERVKAHLDLARGYLEQRDVLKARRPLEQALEIDPTSVEANVLMATVLQVEGEKDLAEASYKKALRSDANDAMARNNYGSFLYAQGRYEEAHKQLLVAIQDTSYTARGQAYENLALTELKLGRPDDAEKNLQRALMLNSQQPRALLELANLYFERGTYPAAKQYYDAYTGMARQTPRSLWLGIRLARVFDDADAIASYALALKNLYPGTEEYRLYQDSLK
jgi:type IV pilus assembly protein PilF